MGAGGEVLSPSSLGSQLPPFPQCCVRLEQSPDLQEELGLCAHWGSFTFHPLTFPARNSS